MDNFDFDKIIYHRPYQYVGKRFITSVIGIDSEAYTDGKPFMFCTSVGDVLTLKDIPHVFFSRKYRNKHFVVHNLKYDSGALIYNLPTWKKEILWLEGKVKHCGYTYKYIPHKLLRISKGKNSVSVWDILPFFSMSLNDASERYLNDKKIDLDTSLFTRKYVRKHWDTIALYCLKDAKLTYKLGMFLLNKLHEFGIRPNNLYSPASVSFMYFKRNSKVVDVYRYWKYYKELLRYACLSYRGGKFDIIARGKFTGYLYDINSAYPYEVSRLVDISNGIVYHTKNYRKDCIYGFLHVWINTDKLMYHPVSIKDNNVNIYPVGQFEAYITKDEYDWMIKHGARVRIIDGWWIKVNKVRYPYRDIIRKLYRLKSYYKDKDDMMYKLVKLMLNSFYGKMVQLTPDHKGNLIAGQGWNIIYGAVISARVRIKMSELQLRLHKNCIAVHTDSIITLKRLPDKYIGNRIGQFSLKLKGDGVMLLCGTYQIGNKSAFRGFVLNHGDSWIKILKRYPHAKYIAFKDKIVLSWINALHLKRPGEINKFIKVKKKLDINSDTKRLWLKDTDSTKLLGKLEYSLPKIVTFT